MSYVLSTNDTFPNDTFLKWGDDQLGAASDEITWSLSLTGLKLSGFDIGLFIAAAQDVFDAWASVANLAFRYIEGDADIDVTTASETEVAQLAGSIVGLASYSFNPGDVTGNGVAEIIASTIYMDTDPSWSPSGERTILSYFGVLLHEVGHALGLGHVADPEQIMNTPISTNSLGAGDIAGIRELYGARYGTDGADNLDLSALLSGQTIRLAAGDDILIATDFADIILGGAGGDTVNGGAGNDRIVDTRGANDLSGDAGNDTIIGGSGVLTATGDTGNDIMIGGIGHDRLDGGADDDILRGDPLGSFLHGNDRLIAGTGTDILAGGGGADVFVFVQNGGANTIASFDISGASATITGADFEVGIDRIDLIDFNLIAAPTAIDTSNNAVLTLGSTTITLVGILASDLDAGDFIL